MAEAAPSISFKLPHQGVAVIDGETPVSFAVGFVAGLGGLNPSWAAFSAVGFEALLVVLEDGPGGMFDKQSSESYGNQLVDVMVGILGVYAGEAFRNRRVQQSQLGPAATAAPVAVPQQDDITSEMIAASNNSGQEPLTGLNRVRWTR
jgi:hypothetical protein